MSALIAILLIIIVLGIPECRDLLIAAIVFSVYLAIWGVVIVVALSAAAWVLIP